MSGQHINDLQKAASVIESVKSNNEQTLFVSAARTASGVGSDITNTSAKGLHVVIDMTAVPSVETVTFTLQGKDNLSGEYYDLLVSAAIVATSTVVLKVYPGITVVSNLSASDVVPDTFRVKTTHSASGSFTYSVSAKLIV